MLSAIKIRDIRLLPGATGGIFAKSAILTLEIEGEIDDWLAVEARLRDKVTRLRPSELLWGVQASDWPGVFVVSPGEPANFSDWVVALTIAIQRWARDPVLQGRVLETSSQSMTLALPWEREQIFKGALQFALHYLMLWMQPSTNLEAAAQLSKTFDQWLSSVESGGLAPNTLRFALAALQRNIPVSVSVGMLRLGWGVNAERMDSSFTGHTSNLATRIARHKFHTSQVLQDSGVPVPPTALVPSWDEALRIAKVLNWPVVIKPSDQDQGAGVVPGIRDEETLRRAYDAASKLSPGAVIVEKHIEGEDHRMLIVGGKLLMATKRVPAGVTGDGVNTLKQLIERVNADPLRGASKRSMLIALTLDEEVQRCLTEQGLTVDSVPTIGRFVRLRYIANISAGGTAEDVTIKVHPDNCHLAERAVQQIGLDIAGVDFLCPDITRSWREVGGAICEVNAQPGFRVHWLGDPVRDINGEVIDWLFRNKPPRIPTAAITGTNGKSTTARMLHHIWMVAGKNAGVCTTNGVWVGRNLISDQNLSGHPGARVLLNDPTVEVAVIEMPRKGLIVFGHPCDRYDVAALLNVQDDHIGVEGVNTLEEMAQLKAEVLERASKAIVVNAEDNLCLAMRARASAPRHILVARDANTPALLDHLNQGGAGVFAQQVNEIPWIILAEGATQTRLMPLAEIPATMNGLLRFNEVNALFATALAWAHEIAPETIRKALASFANSVEYNPGRYNFIEGFPFKILLDYGHNPDGVRELCNVVEKLPVLGRRRLMSLNLGNRHRAHLDAVAPDLARTFDDFILGCNQSRVLKCTDYVSDDPEATMLAASQECLARQGVAAEFMTTERDEAKALQRALSSAQPGDLLVMLAEPWLALPVLDKARQSFTRPDRGVEFL